MEFFPFCITGLKSYTGLEKLFQGLEKLYHGIRKTVWVLQYPGRPDVKIQSNGVLTESYKNFGGDYGKRA